MSALSVTTLRDLSGHSGCRVMLCEADGRPFIRKQSTSLGYNDRLKRQLLKQKHFSMESVRTPAVLDAGYDGPFFYFDMEYVPARKMAESIDHLDIDDILHFLDLLFHNLPLRRQKPGTRAAALFSRKIGAVAESLPRREATVLKAVRKLRHFDFSTVPHSYCCGDLTLENILITENKRIYLIDFLDSFYNSWMIDVAKLFQDLEFRWSYRALPKDIHRELKLRIATEVLVKKLVELEEGVSKLYMIYHIILLNTLRILPYTHDAPTLRYLDRTMGDVMKRIDVIKEYL